MESSLHRSLSPDLNIPLCSVATRRRAGSAADARIERAPYRMRCHVDFDRARRRVVTPAGIAGDGWRQRGAVERHLRGRIDADRSEEHTSELQSLMRISYAVFCLKKTKNKDKH